MALLDRNILSEGNKKALDKVKEIIAEEKLYWDWESIREALFDYNVDLETLKVYDGKLTHLYVMLISGLPADRKNKTEVYKLMSKFSEAGIHPSRLHRLLSEVLQERHFFTDTEEDLEMQNLTEADPTDQIALQNLIYLYISKEAAKKSFQLTRNSLK